MRYRIEGDRCPSLLITLGEGESVFVEPEMVLETRSGVEMRRHIRGRFLRGLKRKILTGKSFFLDEYKAVSSAEESAALRLGRPQGGKIVPVYLHGQVILFRRDAFLGFHGEMDLDAMLALDVSSPRGRVGLGRMQVLQKISGSGVAFLYADSYLVKSPSEMAKILRYGLEPLPLLGQPAKGAAFNRGFGGWRAASKRRVTKVCYKPRQGEIFS